MAEFKDYNHSFIQLVKTSINKNKFFALSTFALLFAFVTCTPEDKNNGGNGGNQNNPEKLTITGDALDVTDHSAMLTGYANLPFELGDAEVGIMYDKSQSFADVTKVVATGLDGNNKFTVMVISLEPSTTYYYKSYVQNGMTLKCGDVKSFTTNESTIPVGAVDLGIVMTREDGSTYNLYWSKSNLSTSGLCANPEDYGDYYAWGETEPYYTEGHSQDIPCSNWRSRTNPEITGYNFSSYKWYNDLQSTFSKYNTSSSHGPVDNKTELDPEDDVAHVKLGGNWRMPTDAEWTALRTRCTWTWTTQNGINGSLVTASNGNSIFLPAAGVRCGTYLNSAGVIGHYWSSSIDVISPNEVWDAGFDSGSVSRGNGLRCDGFSVRPVSE